MSNDDLHELVSASVDGELDPHEHRRLLSRLAEDGALKHRFERYHLIGEALRGDLPEAVPKGLADRVREVLSQEPTVCAPPAREPGSPPRETGAVASRLRPLVGLALAAAFAAVTFVVLNAPDEVGPPVTVATAPVTSPARLATAQRVDARLNAYLVGHYEHAPSGGFTGVLPYATLVSHEVR